MDQKRRWIRDAPKYSAELTAILGQDQRLRPNAPQRSQQKEVQDPQNVESEPTSLHLPEGSEAERSRLTPRIPSHQHLEPDVSQNDLDDKKIRDSRRRSVRRDSFARRDSTDTPMRHSRVPTSELRRKSTVTGAEHQEDSIIRRRQLEIPKMSLLNANTASSSKDVPNMKISSQSSKRIFIAPESDPKVPNRGELSKSNSKKKTTRVFFDASILDSRSSNAPEAMGIIPPNPTLGTPNQKNNREKLTFSRASTRRLPSPLEGSTSSTENPKDLQLVGQLVQPLSHPIVEKPTGPRLSRSREEENKSSQGKGKGDNETDDGQLGIIDEEDGESEFLSEYVISGSGLDIASELPRATHHREHTEVGVESREVEPEENQIPLEDRVFPYERLDDVDSVIVKYAQLIKERAKRLNVAKYMDQPEPYTNALERSFSSNINDTEHGSIAETDTSVSAGGEVLQVPGEFGLESVAEEEGEESARPSFVAEDLSGVNAPKSTGELVGIIPSDSDGVFLVPTFRPFLPAESNADFGASRRPTPMEIDRKIVPEIPEAMTSMHSNAESSFKTENVEESGLVEDRTNELFGPLDLIRQAMVVTSIQFISNRKRKKLHDRYITNPSPAEVSPRHTDKTSQPPSHEQSSGFLFSKYYTPDPMLDLPVSSSISLGESSPAVSTPKSSSSPEPSQIRTQRHILAHHRTTMGPTQIVLPPFEEDVETEVHEEQDIQIKLPSVSFTHYRGNTENEDEIRHLDDVMMEDQRPTIADTLFPMQLPAFFVFDENLQTKPLEVLDAEMKAEASEQDVRTESNDPTGLEVFGLSIKLESATLQKATGGNFFAPAPPRMIIPNMFFTPMFSIPPTPLGFRGGSNEPRILEQEPEEKEDEMHFEEMLRILTKPRSSSAERKKNATVAAQKVEESGGEFGVIKDIPESQDGLHDNASGQIRTPRNTRSRERRKKKKNKVDHFPASSEQEFDQVVPPDSADIKMEQDLVTVQVTAPEINEANMEDFVRSMVSEENSDEWTGEDSEPFVKKDKKSKNRSRRKRSWRKKKRPFVEQFSAVGEEPSDIDSYDQIMANNRPSFTFSESPGGDPVDGLVSRRSSRMIDSLTEQQRGRGSLSIPVMGSGDLFPPSRSRSMSTASNVPLQQSLLDPSMALPRSRAPSSRLRSSSIRSARSGRFSRSATHSRAHSLPEPVPETPREYYLRRHRRSKTAALLQQHLESIGLPEQRNGESNTAANSVSPSAQPLSWNIAEWNKGVPTPTTQQSHQSMALAAGPSMESVCRDPAGQRIPRPVSAIPEFSENDYDDIEYGIHERPSTTVPPQKTLVTDSTFSLAGNSTATQINGDSATGNFMSRRNSLSMPARRRSSVLSRISRSNRSSIDDFSEISVSADGLTKTPAPPVGVSALVSPSYVGAFTLENSSTPVALPFMFETVHNTEHRRKTMTEAEMARYPIFTEQQASSNAMIETYNTLNVLGSTASLNSNNEALEPEAEIHKLSSMLANLTVPVPAYLRRRGWLYARLEKYENALTDLTRAIQYDPFNADAYWYRHQVYLKRGHIEAGIRDLDSITETNKQHFGAFQAKAKIYQLIGAIKLAIVNYSQVIKLKPDDPDGYYQRACLFEAENETVYANEDFKTVRQLDPSNEHAIRNLAVYSFERQLWEDAIQAFTKLIRLHPDEGSPFAFRGRAYANLAQWELALRDLTWAIQLEPDRPDFFYFRGCLLRERNVRKAIEDLSISILIDNTNSNSTSYYQRAILYYKIGQYDNAISDYMTVIELDPLHWPSYLNLGVLYMKFLSEYRKALDCFNKAVQHDPTQLRAYLCRGDVYQTLHTETLGDLTDSIMMPEKRRRKMTYLSFLDRAVRDYSRTIHLCPNNYLLYLYRGRLLLKMSRMKEATYDFHAAFELNSGIAQTFAQRALVLSFQRKFSQIIEEFNQRSRIELIDDPSLLMLIAKARVRCNDYVGALKELAKALEFNRKDPQIYLQRGICYEHLKDWTAAAAEFTKCIQLNSSFAKAYYHRGLCKIHLESAVSSAKDVVISVPGGKGITDIDRAIKADPKFFEAFLSRAAYHHTKGEYIEGVEDCNEALKIEPTSIRAHLLRGACKCKLHQFTLAIVDFSNAIQLDRACHFAFYNRAVTYQLLDDLENAIKDYSIVLLLHEDSNAYRNRGLIYWKLGDHVNALLDLYAARDNFPQDARLHGLLALCLQKVGRIEESLQSFSAAIQVNPYLIEAHLGRGNVYASMGQHALARRDYSRVVHMYPRCTAAYVNMAYTMQTEGRYKWAWQIFTLALAHDSVCTPALEGRSIVHFAMGNYFGALVDISKAVEIDPTNPEYLTNRGVTFQHLKDYSSALQSYKLAIKHDEHYGLAYFNAGNLYFYQRQWDVALQYYEKATELLPEDGSTALNRAICKAMVKDKEGALEEFDRAIELNPGAAHVYFNRANLFQSMGRYDEAEKDYTRVLELTPSDRVAHLLRGETRAQQKKLPEAMADYFSYLSQTPDDQIHLKAANRHIASIRVTVV
ncbi:hypothetical protein BJ742DRAFT_826275 [Cladochytrium replicatum]|nr:hypothetical protein BJ742DRAFT_826275 [Cladochytrium replicatum]